jgi:hypothetical protein
MLRESEISFENQTLEGNNIGEIESPDDHANLAIQGEAQLAEIGKEDDANIDKEVNGHTDANKVLGTCSDVI